MSNDCRSCGKPCRGGCTAETREQARPPADRQQPGAPRDRQMTRPEADR